MTEDQKVCCHAIIPAAAVAAGGGDAVSLPGLGLAADTAALVGMAIGLASVFGGVGRSRRVVHRRPF